MADSDRTLKILLQILGDTTGAKDVQAALKETKQTAAEVSTGAEKLAPAYTDASRSAELIGRSLAQGRISGEGLVEVIGLLPGAFGAIAVLGLGIAIEMRDIAQFTQKLTDEIFKQDQALTKALISWREIVSTAKDLGDAIKVGDKVEAELQKLTDKLKEIQNTDLGSIRSTLEALDSAFRGFGGDTAQFGLWTQALKDAEAAQRRLISQTIILANQEIDAALRAAEAWKQLQLEPVAQAVTELTAKQLGLADAMSKVDRSTVAGEQEFLRLLGIYKLVGGELDVMTAKLAQVQAFNQKLSVTEAHAFGGEDEIAKAEWGQRYNQILVERTKLNLDVSATTINAQIYTEQLAAERDKERSALDRETGSTKDWTASLREAEILIQRIRQQQELIQANPFLSSDQKSSQSLQSMESELTALEAELQKLQTLKPIDPAQVEQANQKIQLTQFEIDLLKEKIAGLKAPFAAELVQWANSFGTAAHQAAGALTSTLGTAISGTSQALTGLIFGTKNWQQAFQQAAQSIVQHLIQIALQYVVSKLVMAAIDRVTGQTTGSAASAAASGAAAAWAPAATSASIASYGAASTTGVAAYVAALAVGEAAAVGISSAGGSFKGEYGGYTGGTEGIVAGIVHGQEFVFSAPAVRNIGVENLEAAHKSAVGLTSPAGSTSGSGGAGRSAPHVSNHALFFDIREARKWLFDTEGEKHLIDIFNRKRAFIG